MENLTRRQGIALAAGVVTSMNLPRPANAAGIGKKNNLGLALIPFTIVNNSGSGQPVYIYMFGLTKALGNNSTYFLSNFNGDLTLLTENKEAKSYSLVMDKPIIHGFFPQLVGVRIYVSVGKPLRVTVNADGIPDSVSANNPPPNNVNYDTLFDFAEVSWTSDPDGVTKLGGNTTQIDSFGLALALERNGFDAARLDTPLTIINGFDGNTDRANIFKDIKAAGAPWDSLIIAHPDSGKPLRALQPLKAIENGLFPEDQMADYINRVLDHYKSNSMVFRHELIKYTGRTDSDKRNFAFTAEGSGATYTIAAPTTRELYANTIKVEPIDGIGHALAAAMGASFLRTTLIFNADVPVEQKNRNEYHFQQPVCVYAKALHKYGINRHAFAFGYDEVAGDSGNIVVANPTLMRLVLLGL